MFEKNLKYLRKKRKWTQADLAKRLGFKAQTTINKWESGENHPTFRTMPKIADLFGVSIEELMHTDLEQRDHDMLADIDNISVPAARGVPILGTICAGTGIDAIENYDGVFFVDNTIRADFCLSVKGDSMIGAGITNGDKAFIVKNCNYDNGKIYAVVVGDETTAILRKCYWQSGDLILQPCNKRVSPIVTSEAETRIIGECVGIYHIYK